jgi:hypothetical protein
MCRVSLRLSNASGGAEGSQELRHTILRGTLRSGSEIAEVSDHRISVIGGFELRLTAFCLILNEWFIISTRSLLWTLVDLHLALSLSLWRPNFW